VDKICWTLAGPAGTGPDEFARDVLDELPAQVAERLPGAASVFVTLQKADEFSGAVVPVDGDERSVDALLEVEVADLYAPLDPVHDLLRSRCGHVQGWRVHPTLIYDASVPEPLGQPSSMPAVVAFVERVDGVTPGFFHRNWYIHAGHSDGREAESAASRAERAREEATPGIRYVQNRVIEPVTPTAWLIHGYTQLFFPMFMPSIEGQEPYERVRGEEAFDRWPTRILQGHEYRIR
jgi:hypothetical protein